MEKNPSTNPDIKPLVSFFDSSDVFSSHTQVYNIVVKFLSQPKFNLRAYAISNGLHYQSLVSFRNKKLKRGVHTTMLRVLLIEKINYTEKITYEIKLEPKKSK